MLEQVQSRLSIHDISTRQLARDLEISPSLLSMVLTGQRKPSKHVRQKLDRDRHHGWVAKIQSRYSMHKSVKEVTWAKLFDPRPKFGKPHIGRG